MIQASAASMLKEATIAVHNYILTQPDCSIKLSVHDELVVQIPKGREDIAKRIREIMEEVGSSYLIGLSMQSSMKMATHWQK